MDTFTSACSRASHAVNHVSKLVLGTVVILMFCSLFLQVICRYVFHNPLSWPEEVTMFLMAWMTFIGSAIAVRHWGHIGVDVVINRLQGSKRWTLLFSIRILVLIFVLFLLYEGSLFALRSVNMVSDGMRISMLYPRLAMPIGAAIMLLHLVALMLEDIAALRKMK